MGDSGPVLKELLRQGRRLRAGYPMSVPHIASRTRLNLWQCRTLHGECVTRTGFPPENPPEHSLEGINVFANKKNKPKVEERKSLLLAAAPSSVLDSG
eukprot:2070929-Rhodomonas_salina.2